MGEDGQERRVRLREGDLERPGIGRAHLPDDARRAAQEVAPGAGRGPRLGTQEALEGRDDVGRGERRAVVEAHAVTEREGPDEPVARDAPARRQGRLDLGRALAVRQERVEHLAGDQRDGALEGRGGVERGRHAGHADAHLAAAGGARGRARPLGRKRRRWSEKQHAEQQGAKHRRGAHRDSYTWNPPCALPVSTTSPGGAAARPRGTEFAPDIRGVVAPEEDEEAGAGGPNDA